MFFKEKKKKERTHGKAPGAQIKIWKSSPTLKCPWQATKYKHQCDQFSSVQSLSHVWLFATPWPAAHQAFLSFPSVGFCSNSCLLSQWCHPTISSCHPLLLLPSTVPSIGVFSNEPPLCTMARVLKLQHQSFQWIYSGLISFRMDWFDLLAVQGTLKSLLQHHSSKASILPCSAFFMVQLSHLHMTTGKP